MQGMQVRQAACELPQRRHGLQAPVVQPWVFHVLRSSEGPSVTSRLAPPGQPPPPTEPLAPAHLLQGGSAELQGNVVELGSPLGTEVAEHVGVPVGLLQQLDLPPNQAEAFTEEPLDSHCPPLKPSPGRWGMRFREGR